MSRIYRTDSRCRSPAPFLGPPDQAMVEGIVEDVLDRVRVLLLRLDQLRPEAAAEDMIAAPVALVEGSGVGAVQVPHAVGEVRRRRLDDQVVVVSQQAADVGPPAVAAFDPSEDVEEDDAIVVVEHDRQLIVPAGAHVVVSAVSQVSPCTAHLSTVAPASRQPRPRDGLGTPPVRTGHVPGTGLRTESHPRWGQVWTGHVPLGRVPRSQAGLVLAVWRRVSPAR
jgi:hypothetical protein